MGDAGSGTHGTAERHPPEQGDWPANSVFSTHGTWHPSTENGKPFTHGERLVLSTGSKEAPLRNTSEIVSALSVTEAMCVMTAEALVSRWRGGDLGGARLDAPS